MVDGQPWDEAPDLEDEEALDLESLLDDTILETTRRRRSYPKRILPHVVHALKAERKILGLMQSSVRPEDLQQRPDPEDLMRTLSAAAPGTVRRAIQVIQSIHALQTQAQGLCEVLGTKPSSASLRIHSEVLGPAHRPAGGGAGSGRPIRRMVEEAAASEGYVADAQETE